MIRNFLFRLIIALYCVIGFPIWLITVLIYWVFAICTFCILVFPVWLFFGKQGFKTLCKYLDLETYREIFGFDLVYDANITTLWFFKVFDWLKDKYNSSKCQHFI